MSSEFVKLVGNRELQVKLKKLPGNVLSKEVMSEIGLFLTTSIKMRTAKGKDVDDKQFSGYSLGYKKIRAKKGLPSDKVDLFFTGAMSASMTLEATENKVRLFFTPSTDRSGMFNPEKAYYVNKRRNFFAVNSKEVAEVNNIITNSIRDVL